MTTQMDASIGIKEEAVYGTAVTVDRHLEFNSESLEFSQTFVQGTGMRAGSRAPRANRRSVGQVSVAGAIEFDAFSRGMGVILQAALGLASSTVIAAGTAYQQVHTPATTDSKKSYTIQKGLPPVGGGATLAQTFTGMMCNTLELSCDVGGILKIATEWIGKDMSTAPAYAAPTYPAAANGQIWTFKDGAIVVGGTVTAPTTTVLATGGTTVAVVTQASVKVNNNLDTNGYFLGGNGRRGRASVVQWAEDMISGSITVEYLDNTFLNYYLNQTDLALVLTFKGSVPISGTDVPTLQVYVPLIRLNGETPKVNGGQVTTQTIPFTGLDNTTSSAPIYISYVTADVAI